ncbi:MAG: tRNA pseudouridine(55) synthase TruB [Pseudomonadota bacterium]|nr:tRNA pseudouridine(55) synthase TruB [Pseudomonadota bacterium]
MTKRSRKAREINGIALLNKPLGMTSNQALQQTKKLFAAVKAGHTGSLDPLATGMLPICFGFATRLSSYLFNSEKSYTVCGELGVATETGDTEGKVILRGRKLNIGQAEIASTLELFLGDTEQIPPMYSALKYKGRRLYDLARQGINVEREARKIYISSISLVRYQWPEFVFTVSCSKGTYVRTLVQDIATRLGTCAHVRSLHRNAAQPFREEQMLGMPVFSSFAEEGLNKLDELLLPPDEAIACWPRILISDTKRTQLLRGQTVEAEPQWPRSQVRLYSSYEGLFGVGEVLVEGKLAPRKMMVDSPLGIKIIGRVQ